MDKIEIRPYKAADFDVIHAWWIQSGQNPPSPGCMIEDGTFVAEINGEPALSLTVLKTQSKQIALFEGYIAKPGLEKGLRNEAGAQLWERCYQYALEHGYRNAIVYSGKPQLTARYEKLGMTRSLEGLSALYRRL